MRKLFAIAAVCLLPVLAACAGLKTTVQTVTGLAGINAPQVVTPEVRRQIHLGYEILLTAAVHYRRLPQCRASQAATVSSPCARRSVIIALQGANRKARSAIAALDAWAVANPTINASAVISGANAAVAEFRSIFTANGIAVPAN